MARNIYITVELKKSIEGCNGHERTYEELVDENGELRPSESQDLYYINTRGMVVRLCQKCKDFLDKQLIQFD